MEFAIWFIVGVILLVAYFRPAKWERNLERNWDPLKGKVNPKPIKILLFLPVFICYGSAAIARLAFHYWPQGSAGLAQGVVGLAWLALFLWAAWGALKERN